MKTKLIFSTEKKDTEHWMDLPFVPHLEEWINVADFLNEKDLIALKKNAECWSGMRGKVQSVEYRKENHDFYAEIYVWCED